VIDDRVAVRHRGRLSRETGLATPSALSWVKRRPHFLFVAGAHVGEAHQIVKARTTVGRSPSADIMVLDEGTSREHVEILIDGDRLVVRDLNSTNGTFRNGEPIEAAEIAEGDKLTLGTTAVLMLSYRDGLDAAVEEHLCRAVTHDELTDALKRESFLERLESDLERSRRHSTPVALIAWDLDDLRALNDRHGYSAGDQILAATTKAVAGSIRREDAVGRRGGEEFTLSSRGTPPDVALKVAERLRRTVEETVVDCDGSPVRVTASFGVAESIANRIDDAGALLAAADAALARAKAEGKNRVDFYKSGI
jgi:diguanylate cyclase (GGDEF)-like protein